MSAIPPPVPYTPATRVVDDDVDYEYFWSRGGLDIPIPQWIAEIVDVPWMVRLEIFLGGICIGLVLAVIGLIVGFAIAMG